MNFRPTYWTDRNKQEEEEKKNQFVVPKESEFLFRYTGRYLIIFFRYLFHYGRNGYLKVIHVDIIFYRTLKRTNLINVASNILR